MYLFARLTQPVSRRIRKHRNRLPERTSKRRNFGWLRRTRVIIDQQPRGTNGWTHARTRAHSCRGAAVRGYQGGGVCVLCAVRLVPVQGPEGAEGVKKPKNVYRPLRLRRHPSDIHVPPIYAFYPFLRGPPLSLTRHSAPHRWIIYAKE